MGTVSATLPVARAQTTATVTTLHTFGADRGSPNGLTLGVDGNFYGTTFGILPVPNSGVVEIPGTAFRITPAGKLTLYNVFDEGPAGSGLIQHPLGTLALGSDGNFYGTSQGAFATVRGGSTVFQLTPAGGLTTLDNGVDVPNGGLVQASDGSFYGTDQHGEADHSGSVFKVTTTGTFTTLYSFTDFSDGGVPTAPLVLGSDGNFYGTTSGAATESHEYTDIGTLFRITPAGALTTLATYAYDSEPTGLVAASDGNLYYLLGNTVFRSALDGTATALYTFTGGSDGASPNTLGQAADGDFYGTTASTIFRLTLAGELTTLCAFTGEAGPSALVQGGDGNFYGTTGGGITGLAATIFKVTVPPTIVSAATAAATVGQAFSYQITASNLPTSFAASGLPAGLSVDPATGRIAGTPTAAGTSTLSLSAANNNSASVATAALTLVVAASGGSSSPAFFTGEVALADGVYYLSFPSGNPFGYYSYLTDLHYIYHFDLGYEYVLDANDGASGVYLYDFASSDFFYTSPGFPFPYLFDFGLNAVLYYYPDATNPGHYTSNPRYFFNFATGTIITR